MNFFDLQLNGYAGVDFNGDSLSVEQLRGCCETLKADNVDGFLATVITDSMESMSARLSRIVELREEDDLIREMIPGFHIEGPFINPMKGYVGAHPAKEVRPATTDDMKVLLDAAGGLTKIVTLAPECDENSATTKMLVENGVYVSAGHCNPSIDELKASVDAGLSLFTHLGNGCPMDMNRHDNIVQRALSLSDQLWLTFIADGAHIPFFALKNYLDAAGLERCVIVSDAISAGGLGPGKYTLAGWELDIGEDLVPWAPDRSHLVGSACPMKKMKENLQQELGLSDADINVLMVENPRKAIGMN